MIIAGTGHRPHKLGGYSEKVYSKLWNLAHDFLYHHKNKIDEVISGGALGWDIALANAALYEKIPVTMAIPFLGQENKWYQSDRERYRYTLYRTKEQGGIVKIICDGEYSSEKMQIRNEWMVDHCNAVLALWDGSFGGTGNCIKYANKQKKKIINLWDEYKLSL